MGSFEFAHAVSNYLKTDFVSNSDKYEDMNLAELYEIFRILSKIYLTLVRADASCVMIETCGENIDHILQTIEQKLQAKRTNFLLKINQICSCYIYRSN